MNALIRTLGRLTLWLERRFPEKMTTTDVLAKFLAFEARLNALERNDELQRLRAEVQKLKIFSGIAQITSINGD